MYVYSYERNQLAVLVIVAKHDGDVSLVLANIQQMASTLVKTTHTQ